MDVTTWPGVYARVGLSAPCALNGVFAPATHLRYRISSSPPRGLPMTRTRRLVRILFGLGMMSVGVLALVYG